DEELDGYFRLVQVAAQRFREAGEPGWLTDRGEVFITLGEPDDVFDFTSDVSRSGIRGVRWTYREQRLTLFFQDNAGFGRFRLTPLSRAEFQRIVELGPRQRCQAEAPESRIDASLAGRVPTHRGSASPAVRRAGGLLLVVAAALPQSAATAQQTSPYVAAERAESLRLAGRPWHAAETLLAAAAREPRLNAT